jgi:alanyl-tRNA synthetase
MTEMPLEEAQKLGAMALFGEKYGKTVRVVRMGDSSIEFCGGTHVDSTGKIGLFKVVSESSVAAGVRRIEGTTGYGVLALMGKKDALIAETAKELKVGNPADVAKRAAQLESELKETKRELESANAKLSSAKLAAIIDKATQVGAYKLLTARLEMKVDAARTLCDSIRADHPDMVAVFALVNDGKLNFIACCGADAVKAGAHAGNILRSVSAICGGKGGGRPDSAMSGGSDLSKIDEALASVAGLLG